MYVRGGSGGQGAATFKLINGRQKGMPDGGSGGRGGDVVFVCDGKINTLQVRMYYVGLLVVWPGRHTLLPRLF